MSMLEVIPLSAYCDMTGETAKAVRVRVSRGYWMLGREVLRPKGSRQLWVDLSAVNVWARLDDGVDAG